MAISRCCPRCEREINVELTDFNGADELLESAAEGDGWRFLDGCSAEVVLSCGCSHLPLTLTQDSVSIADIPSYWYGEGEE